MKPKEEDDDDGKSSSSSSSAEGTSASAVDKMEGESEEAKEKRTNRKRTRDDPRRRRSHHGNDNHGNGNNHGNNHHNISIKDRLGPREWDVTMTCDENDDEDKVITVIQNRLKEPKRHLVAGVSVSLWLDDGREVGVPGEEGEWLVDQ